MEFFVFCTVIHQYLYSETALRRAPCCVQEGLHGQVLYQIWSDFSAPALLVSLLIENQNLLIRRILIPLQEMSERI